MNARTFGRRGVSDGGMPGRRAASFGLKPEAQPASEAEEMAIRREAFLAEEHDRAVTEAPTETVAYEITPAAVSEAVWGKPKSLWLAYALWFGLGLVGAHRFYLGRYMTGALQAVLGAASLALLFAGYIYGLPGLTIALAWMSADTFYIGKMHARPPGGSLFG